MGFSTKSHAIEVQDLEQENKEKDKEITKLNLATTQSKSKKELQPIIDETIS